VVGEPIESIRLEDPDIEEFILGQTYFDVPNMAAGASPTSVAEPVDELGFRKNQTWRRANILVIYYLDDCRTAIFLFHYALNFVFR
jgi:hypothetical protein